LGIHQYVPGWNIYDYLPPLFALYLLAISSLPDGLLKVLLRWQYGRRPIAQNEEVKQDAENNQKVQESQLEFIKNVAVDWTLRTSLLTSIIAGIISVLVTFSEPQSYGWATFMITTILVIYTPMSIWVFTYHVGALPAVGRTKKPWSDEYIQKSPAFSQCLESCGLGFSAVSRASIVR
jgi:hypothetical protein